MMDDRCGEPEDALFDLPEGTVTVGGCDWQIEGSGVHERPFGTEVSTDWGDSRVRRPKSGAADLVERTVRCANPVEPRECIDRQSEHIRQSCASERVEFAQNAHLRGVQIEEE
ncbi:hypothetical protein MHK71_08245 [Kocuria indica]|uniref:hypothetical protein n=1 Tax=Kocuria marina TaxID=223184 RepID=UPI001EF529B1|nr:hypothetical protein [Kocuria indica]MCG7432488.1 hypothetical protein [Kocuria indica]